MIGTAKNKSFFPPALSALWTILFLVVALFLPETRVWGFAVTPQPASGVFESVTPSSIGENYDGCPYDASDSLLAARTTPSAFARSQQGSVAYPGVDRWRDITLKKGTIIYGGEPGQSAFYTTRSAIGRTGDSATDIFQGIQVAPHRVHGYRPAMTAYEVIDDVPAAFGRTLANPQYGAGGLPQVVVPDFSKFLRPIHTAPLSP